MSQSLSAEVVKEGSGIVSNFGGLELLMLANWDCEIHLTCLDDGASEDSHVR